MGIRKIYARKFSDDGGYTNEIFTVGRKNGAYYRVKKVKLRSDGSSIDFTSHAPLHQDQIDITTEFDGEEGQEHLIETLRHGPSVSHGGTRKTRKTRKSKKAKKSRKTRKH